MTKDSLDIKVGGRTFRLETANFNEPIKANLQALFEDRSYSVEQLLHMFIELSNKYVTQNISLEEINTLLQQTLQEPPKKAIS
ncbi:hypothetical protein BKH43_01045 [Helicobacter sp. 13S00401-1]|uniref:hypothetical protein n=1 Tax=Helicobacter sp. 13S00401-1 TaxID=1905758 RepID=UPI000BA5A218|nr:hypothetical protein [Helicobacter sp. 13S00401-1]PAF51850.1 hypothetical protein BKH43_01045 [Helicobacter sp. 13S00401-1]